MTNTNYSTLKEIYDNNKTEILISLVVGFSVTILVPFIAFLMNFLTTILSNKYIELIGIPNLNFTSTNNGIVQDYFSLNILLATTSIIYIICIAPMLLRLFYHYNREYLPLEQINKTKIIASFLLFIIFPFVAFIFVLFLESQASFLSITLLISVPIVTYLKIGSYKINQYDGYYILDNEDRVKYIIISLLYMLFIAVTFFPFFIIFKVVLEYFSLNNIGTDLEIIITILMFLFLYGTLYGSRTLFHSFYQYIIDLILAIIILIILYIFIPSALIVPVVEMSGIKDKTAHYYTIERSYYDNYLRSSIEHLWLYDLDNRISGCKTNIVGNSCLLFISEMDQSEYLIINLMVIYKDNKQAIVCPPNFKLSKLNKPNKYGFKFFKNVELCSVIDSHKLLPSTKSTYYLENNKNFRNTYRNIRSFD